MTENRLTVPINPALALRDLNRRPAVAPSDLDNEELQHNEELQIQSATTPINTTILQSDKPTNQHTDRPTNLETNQQTNKHPDRHTNWLTSLLRLNRVWMVALTGPGRRQQTAQWSLRCDWLSQRLKRWTSTVIVIASASRTLYRRLSTCTSLPRRSRHESAAH